MSKFNQTNTNLTTNHEGHVAYKMQDKLKLVTQVLTTFYNEDKFYGDNSKELTQLAEKLAVTDPNFISNLAVYARKEFHLRSVSHVLTCIVAKTNESKEFIAKTVNGVVERADDLTEILACYLSMYGKPIPNGLKKTLGRGLKRFNEFQISKYAGGNKNVKFKDILKLCHVKPDNAKQNELFKKIIEDNLQVATRWETEVSAKGNNEQTWESLIENNQLGYMAALRNLRNIINAQPKNIQKVYDLIADKEQVLKSKQLPFRFLAAYREVQNLPQTTNKVLDTLETAIEHSISNMPKLQGKTVIAYDISGSMSDRISKNSNIECCDISALFAVLASKICDEYIVYSFNNRIEKVSILTNSSILNEAQRISWCGGGTDLTLPLQSMINENIKADRLIMISDNEINGGWGAGFKRTCQSLVDKYRNTINKDLYVHAIDLMGYGTQQFIGDKTNIIAGWSEKVLSFISLVEDGMDGLVKTIENYDKK